MKEIIYSKKFNNQLKQLSWILNRIWFSYCVSADEESVNIKITKKK